MQRLPAHQPFSFQSHYEWYPRCTYFNTERTSRMNQMFMDLTGIGRAALGICAAYTDPLANRIRDFLGSRSPQRLDDLSKDIITEKIDEMLAVLPVVAAPNYSNAASLSLEQLTQEVASPRS